MRASPPRCLRRPRDRWVRVQAISKAFRFLSMFMNMAGGLSVSSVVEMLASLVLTVRVVSVPIITR